MYTIQVFRYPRPPQTLLLFPSPCLHLPSYVLQLLSLSTKPGQLRPYASQAYRYTVFNQLSCQDKQPYTSESGARTNKLGAHQCNLVRPTSRCQNCRTKSQQARHQNRNHTNALNLCKYVFGPILMTAYLAKSRVRRSYFVATNWTTRYLVGSKCWRYSFWLKWNGEKLERPPSIVDGFVKFSFHF